MLHRMLTYFQPCCTPSSNHKLAAPLFLAESQPTRKDLKPLLFKAISEKFDLAMNGDVLGIILDYCEHRWSWHSVHSDYTISDDGFKVINQQEGDSNWAKWAYTEPFPDEGVHKLTIKIVNKRADSGWLGIGVIATDYIETAQPQDVGFKMYNKNAMFIDPSWNEDEPHFNLTYLDIERQVSRMFPEQLHVFIMFQHAMGKGDSVTIVVDNTAKRIFFYRNDENTHFAEGNWEHVKYQQVSGYAILTSTNDELQIVP